MTRTAMMISPHADDAAAFCGGTLAKHAALGWRLVIVRVTDDCRDSAGLSLEEARRRNAEQFVEAAKILGASEVIELGYETDCLADVSLVGLRERFVYLFRKHRPYSVFSFGPYGLWEDNMDHLRVARAVYEALWVSAFDLHHPEHFKEGLEPVSVVERWFFGRELPRITHLEDISDHLPAKIDALCAHREMVKNMFNRFNLQVRAWGRRAPFLEAALAGEYRGLIEAFLTEQAREVAARGGLPEGRLGEAFRLERFGDLEGLFQLFTEPIPGIEPVKRSSLDPKKE